MKLIFSEAAPDYPHYIFPYAVWAFPEKSETPADLLAAGFLPSTREMNRFYLTRHVRVKLDEFQPSSENRRILRKCPAISSRLVPRSEFVLTAERNAFCKRYADARFGTGVMSEERLEGLFRAPVATHIMIFQSPVGEDLGFVVLYVERPELAFFYYSFYDLALFKKSLGLYIMTSTVQHFANEKVRYLYLGTCYSERALYKTQFRGCEFFNGFEWSRDIRQLKYLLRRQADRQENHLLEDESFLRSFYPEGLGPLSQIRGFTARPARLAPPTTTA